MKKQEKENDKIIIGSSVHKSVVCEQCKKEGKADTFFSYQKKDKTEMYLCSECRDKMNAAFKEETKNPNYLRAIAGGVIAGIIGGLLWYFIAVLTNREFGYVAIALGFLVGMGVIVGSGGKRGHMLQMIALLLTLFVIFVAEYGIFRHTLNIYIQEHASELNDIDPNMIRDALGVLNPIFLKSLISPIGLVIYAIGAYCAYSIPKPRKI
jgi:hypothetical protein